MHKSIHDMFRYLSQNTVNVSTIYVKLCRMKLSFTANNYMHAQRCLQNLCDLTLEKRTQHIAVQKCN